MKLKLNIKTNKMKKLILLPFLILTILVTSCSSDDDSSSDSTSIIGIWKPTKEVDVCSTGNEETYNFSNCEQMTRITFSSNRTYNETGFKNETGGCLEHYNKNGTWSLTGNNLSITLDEETNNPTFFELIYNTLRIGYYDNDANDPCDGENLPSHYYTEYTRVE